jgi:hypothetical protein
MADETPTSAPRRGRGMSPSFHIRMYGRVTAWGAYRSHMVPGVMKGRDAREDR